MRRAFLGLSVWPSLSSPASSTQQHTGRSNLGVCGRLASHGFSGWVGSLSPCVAQPAGQSRMIIAIKHCFPNTTVSLPLIRSQGLFLFTAKRSYSSLHWLRVHFQALQYEHINFIFLCRWEEDAHCMHLWRGRNVWNERSNCYLHVQELWRHVGLGVICFANELIKFAV